MASGREYRLSILVTGKDAGASGMLGGLSGSIASLWKIAGGILGAAVLYKLGREIFDIGKEAIMAAGRVEELDMVMGVVAKNVGVSKQAMQDQVEALRKQGIVYADAQEAVINFARYQLDLADVTKLAAVAQDAAVVSMEDSTANFSGLMHGILTRNQEVLRTHGITIANIDKVYKDYAKTIGKTVKELTEQEKTQAILNEVIQAGTTIQGAYTEAMKSASKQIRSFPRYLNDIMIALGRPFQDVWSKVVFKVADFLKWLGKAVDEGGVFYPVLLKMADGAEQLFGKFEKMLDLLATGDWNAILKGFSKGWVDMTRAVKQWVAGIDWGQISSDLAAGVQTIDWDQVGASFAEGTTNIGDAMADAFERINWLEVLGSFSFAFLDFIAGMVGTNMDEVFTTWFINLPTIGAEAVEKMKKAMLLKVAETIIGITLMIIQAQENIRAAFLTWGVAGASALSAGTGQITGAIFGWIPPVNQALRELSKTFYARAQGWVQQAAFAVTSMIGTLVAAIKQLIAAAMAAITAIVIPVRWGSPGALNISGVVAGVSFGGGGGGGGLGGGNKPGAARGGIFAGPMSGYDMTLHGTEAVVPLESGAIPVRMNGLGAGFNFTFVYAPAVSAASRREAEDVFAPMVETTLRKELARRGIA